MLSRLDAICDDDSGSPGNPDVLAAYTYLGLGTIVIEDYQEPDVQLDLFGGTTGTYAGLDRFGRVVDQCGTTTKTRGSTIRSTSTNSPTATTWPATGTIARTR